MRPEMIAQTIQLALAPVFVLVALGNIMNLLSSRLGRVVDRSRSLQEQAACRSSTPPPRVTPTIRSCARSAWLTGASC